MRDDHERGEGVAACLSRSMSRVLSKILYYQAVVRCEYVLGDLCGKICPMGANTLSLWMAHVWRPLTCAAELALA